MRIRSNQKFIVITVVFQVTTGTTDKRPFSGIFEGEEGCQAIQSTIHTSVEYLMGKSFHAVITTTSWTWTTEHQTNVLRLKCCLP